MNRKPFPRAPYLYKTTLINLIFHFVWFGYTCLLSWIIEFFIIQQYFYYTRIENGKLGREKWLLVWNILLHCLLLLPMFAGVKIMLYLYRRCLSNLGTIVHSWSDSDIKYVQSESLLNIVIFSYFVLIRWISVDLKRVTF